MSVYYSDYFAYNKKYFIFHDSTLFCIRNLAELLNGDLLERVEWLDKRPFAFVKEMTFTATVKRETIFLGGNVTVKQALDDKRKQWNKMFMQGLMAHMIENLLQPLNLIEDPRKPTETREPIFLLYLKDSKKLDEYFFDKIGFLRNMVNTCTLETLNDMIHYYDAQNDYYAFKQKIITRESVTNFFADEPQLDVDISQDNPNLLVQARNYITVAKYLLIHENSLSTRKNIMAEEIERFDLFPSSVWPRRIDEEKPDLQTSLYWRVEAIVKALTRRLPEGLNDKDIDILKLAISQHFHLLIQHQVNMFVDDIVNKLLSENNDTSATQPNRLQLRF